MNKKKVSLEYQRNQQIGVSERETEAQALDKASAKLQSVLDNDFRNLDDALSSNLLVWYIFHEEVKIRATPLPEDLRENILALARYVFALTEKVKDKPCVPTIQQLIKVNHNISAGLRGK